MNRAYYSDSIINFQNASTDEIIGKLTRTNDFALEQTQRDAWLEEISILRKALKSYQGNICFEYSIPRMGQRIDVVILIGSVIFVLEFKSEAEFQSHALEQVWDYALDLKNFHEPSHNKYIAPILIPTKAKNITPCVSLTPHNDKLFYPIKCTVNLLPMAIESVLKLSEGEKIKFKNWENGRYCPTPTIIEAAMALYNGHNVKDISRNDATAINLSKTTKAISTIIKLSKNHKQKAICFVTGVPGAGKTLIGLNIATTHIDKSKELYSVFLSGNGPLVAILREALTRDKVSRYKEKKQRVSKGEVMSEVKAFIQNVHHFRDDCLINKNKAPIEHVALFDEAQRAWNKEQTSKFMRQKRKSKTDFNISEPEFLISCLNRHKDWAVIVCLVGGGQEINTGEAGISEWIDSLNRSFPKWHIYISPRLTDSEYAAGASLKKLTFHSHVVYKKELHLSVSMRSFRTEHISLLIKQILDQDKKGAKRTLEKVKEKYPIVITRNISAAKNWLRQQARGSERYGIVVSSQAERLKPYAINVKAPINPIHWFLHNKKDVRSSYYLEDVATEFHIQGLELDWVCVTWDADFRYSPNGWEHWSFRGSRWLNIHKPEIKMYQKNAYRVLLTRARQGMVLVIPSGDSKDLTRSPKFYDATYEYLKDIGFTEI